MFKQDIPLNKAYAQGFVVLLQHCFIQTERLLNSTIDNMSQVLFRLLTEFCSVEEKITKTDS